MQVERQKKLLKGFDKVFIPAGASVEVTITAPLDELRYYDVEWQAWVLESGTYTLMVGPNSADQSLLKASVDL